MTKSLIIVGLLITSAFAQASLEDIKNDFDSAQSVLNIEKLTGRYTGTCSDQVVDSKEALYIDSFTNFAKETAILPMTTLQLYGGYTIPENLKYLTSGSKENLTDIAEFIREGYTGVENNQGYVGPGVDYAYVYRAALSEDKKSLTLKISDEKTSGFNPPLLRGCSYGNVQGQWLFQDCFAPNDQTVFKKNSKGQLVSLRTADERLSGTNNLSFRLPAIHQYCTWTKIK